MVAAVIQSGEVNLTRRLGYLPCRGQYTQSKQRRAQRWLNNPCINVHRLYKPLIRKTLADWQEPCLYLSLNTSLFWDEYCLVRVAVARIASGVAGAPSLQCRRQLCRYPGHAKQAASCLPHGVTVILLADQGFVQTDLMRAAQQDWHWHYRICLKHNSWIWWTGQGWCLLNTFHLKPGEAMCFHHVYLHKEQRYGPVHLALGRNNVNGEAWAMVSDEPTTLQTFRE